MRNEYNPATSYAFGMEFGFIDNDVPVIKLLCNIYVIMLQIEFLDHLLSLRKCMK